MSSDGESGKNSTSELFDAADADVTFKSSDDILFKIHRIHLEATSGGFPPAGFETLGEVVVLPEAASTLELLFQFAYPVPLPDIHCAEFSFSDIALLGEAAEKYEVFSAMCVCRMYMKYTLQRKQHIVEILVYAVKHAYKELMDEAAPYLLSTPLSEMISKLPSHLVVRWIHYYSAWERVLHKARAYNFDPKYYLDTDQWGRKDQKSKKCGKDSCNCNSHLTKLIVLERLSTFSSLQDLDLLFSDVGCWHFRNDVASWKTNIAWYINTNVKSFHIFVGTTLPTFTELSK